MTSIPEHNLHSFSEDPPNRLDGDVLHRRPLRPIDDPIRLNLLARMRLAQEAQEKALWGVAATFISSGTDPDHVAAVLGISRATLYRRLIKSRPPRSSEREWALPIEKPSKKKKVNKEGTTSQ